MTEITKGLKMSFTSKQREFLSAAATWSEKKSFSKPQLDKKDLQAIADSAGLKFPHWITRVPTYKVGRGLWSLPSLTRTTVPVPTVDAAKPAAPVVAPTPAPVKVEPVVEMAKGTNGVGQSHIPAKDPLFVPFGSFPDMVTILKSEMFYPVFVTGLSGNGKTIMIDQACAKASRAMYRVNITIETDEDDLLGGFRLVDGETVWFDGPVVEAMRTGSVLLLDEVDLASTKIMCLQPILEGKGVFLKKINEYVDCQPGFNIVATANTKGKGDDTGNFIGAGVLNEAFLERFPITVEQDYPAPTVEKRILSKVFDSLSISDSEFIDKLVNWADIIRKTYVEGAIDELITTRRLVHISNAYAIFNMDRMKAIEMCVNRFDDETKTAMVDLYTKVDSGVDPTAVEAEPTASTEETVEENSNEVPF